MSWLSRLFALLLLPSLAHAADMGAPDLSTGPPCLLPAQPQPLPQQVSPAGPNYIPPQAAQHTVACGDGGMCCPPRYSVVCNNGSCCPDGHTCNADGTCGGPGLSVAYIENVDPRSPSQNLVPLMAPVSVYSAVNQAIDQTLFQCQKVPGCSLLTTWNHIDDYANLPGYTDFDTVNEGPCGGNGCEFPSQSAPGVSECGPPPPGGHALGVIARYRGFLNVPPSWVGKMVQVHFGLGAGPEAELLIFDGAALQTPLLVVHTGHGNNGDEHGTNTVTFASAGMYPMEADFFSIRSGGVIEVSVVVLPGSLPMTFNMGSGDIYPTSVLIHNPVTDRLNSLYYNGFSLLSPGWFYQSASGRITTPVDWTPGSAFSSYQCPRQFAGSQRRGMLGPSVGCPQGYFCNEAAICETCNTDDHCAGNSCNCCAPGTHCKFDSAGTNNFICAQCVSDGDCGQSQHCDLSTHTCVNPPDGGTQSTKSDTCDPTAAPGSNGCSGMTQFCLGGDACVDCRDDLDCQVTRQLAGHYCLSGQCVTCNTDFRCGINCPSCGGDRPFCADHGSMSACVRCVQDSQCPGGQCTAAGDCTNSSSMMCPGATPYAYGTTCVACYASSQCPCGQQCVNNTCQMLTCTAASQCNGDQCCDTINGQCYSGSCDVAGAAPCCAASPLGAAPLPGHPQPTPTERSRDTARSLLVGLLALGTLALLIQLQRRRGRRGPAAGPAPGSAPLGEG